MSQASDTLRRISNGYAHWCPGCGEVHRLPDSWAFDGNLQSPTFSPSFKHTSVRFDAYTPEGLGIGEKRNHVCHYILTAGVLNFCGDSMHALANTSVPLPRLADQQLGEWDRIVLGGGASA